ncbi:MAG TPA: hypothetical protein VEW46_10315 [Pyrinomonadaceae bacterium]|nr:hypothetical protein [Pyrinomonadaceae bacterium]
MSHSKTRMQTPSPRLVHALIAKSIAETLLVGGLAVFAFLTLVPPFFHGWGEVIPTGIQGWAVNSAAPWDRVEVYLYVDDEFVARQVANRSRPDVQAAGWARDEWHGYVFDIPPSSLRRHGTYFHMYQARLYALHNSGDGARKSLQMLGDPIFFYVDDAGRMFRPPSK